MQLPVQLQHITVGLNFVSQMNTVKNIQMSACMEEVVLIELISFVHFCFQLISSINYHYYYFIVSLLYGTS